MLQRTAVSIDYYTIKYKNETSPNSGEYKSLSSMFVSLVCCVMIMYAGDAASKRALWLREKHPLSLCFCPY